MAIKFLLSSDSDSAASLSLAGAAYQYQSNIEIKTIVNFVKQSL